MNISRNHRKETINAVLGAAVAAAAVPAVLFVGAGTAHAGGTVWNNADYAGTTVFIRSDGLTFGNCTYSAYPAVGFGIPPGPRQFVLSDNGIPAQLWFPGAKLNTTWNVNVACDHGDPINATTVY